MKHLFIHIFAWTIYIVFQLVTNPPEGSNFMIIFIDVVISFVSFAAIFYLNTYLLLPKFLKPELIGKLVLSQICSAALFISFHYILYFSIYPIWDDQYFGYGSPTTFCLQFFRIYVYYSIFGTGYWALNNYLVKQKRNNELEKSLLEAELSLLRYQFNPHFLYNSLNLIYAKAYPVSDELAKATLLLADIMRYMLQEKTGDKVDLVQEIQYLNNFIELHRMRFNDRLYIDFNIQGDPKNKEIISFVFISLVENAFKHGQTNNPDAPIQIKINIYDNYLMFYVSNKKNNLANHLSTGIGLLNIQRRLNLIYGVDHHLFISDEEHYFTVELTIHKIKLT